MMESLGKQEGRRREIEGMGDQGRRKDREEEGKGREPERKDSRCFRVTYWCCPWYGEIMEQPDN
jgi:hypothetical protein